MAAAIPFIMLGATALSAGGAVAAGRNQETQALNEADQLMADSKAEYAAGTREANEYRRQGRILESRARAQQAASGGATDAAAIENLGGIAKEVEYNALAAMYTYDNRSRGTARQTRARRSEGEIASRAGRIKGLSTALSGATQAYGTYKYGS